VDENHLMSLNSNKEFLKKQPASPICLDRAFVLIALVKRSILVALPITRKYHFEQPVLLGFLRFSLWFILSFWD
jgi:hypothetical protein